MSLDDHSVRTSVDLKDSSGIVRADLSCIQCAYNLRGLSWRADCPECGARVGQTVVVVRTRERLRAARSGYRAALPLALAGVGGIALANVVVLAAFSGLGMPFGTWLLIRLSFILLWLVLLITSLARLAMLAQKRSADEMSAAACLATMIAAVAAVACNLAYRIAT